MDNEKLLNDSSYRKNDKKTKAQSLQTFHINVINNPNYFINENTKVNTSKYQLSYHTILLSLHKF